MLWNAMQRLKTEVIDIFDILCEKICGVSVCGGGGAEVLGIEPKALLCH
jgi:hypothetical protein